MKRTGFFAAMASLLIVFCLLMSITGCGQDILAAGDGTLQGQINAAHAGGSVTLNPSNTGTSITISKPLSVNGSGIQNLSVTVNANVADDVTLTNFPNATLTITNSSSGNQAHSALIRSAYAARDAGGAGDDAKPRELGDDNPKLRLENSSFTRITADENVTLFLDAEADKVDIDLLELKNRVDEFVLIGNDDEDTAIDDKSRIEMLTVEAGVGEIDLVGGRFADLVFTGDFTDKVDFYYEEKSDYQAGEAFKARLAEATAQAEAMDVCAVRNGSGIYKITVPKEKIEAAQGTRQGGMAGTWGSISIMLMTDEQVAAFVASIPAQVDPQNPLWICPNEETGWNWATKEQPYFDICYTGSYLFNTEDVGLYAVSGDMQYTLHEDGEGGFNTEYYDYYRCYSTDALCSECDGNNFTIWLDMSNLRKSDLNTCAYKANGHDDEYYLTPNKVTEIDLEGYKPYIALDFSMYHEIQSPDGSWENFNQEKADAKAYFGTAKNNVHQIQVPISKNNPNIGSRYVFMFPMVPAASYPSEAAVWKQIDCPELPQNN